jgi:hypothetical protein
MPKNETATTPKAKAPVENITQLVVTRAWGKTFSSGKHGFFGQALNPATGKRYQIIGAVELAG